MGLWDSVYNSRVWTWAVALVWWVISLAVLEADNEASHIASFALASIAAVIGNWYGAYLWYRLWYRLPELQQSLPMTMGDAVPGQRRAVPKGGRSLYSIGAWVDCWIMLIIVWAMWSQMTHTLWPHTFDTTTFHLSHNHWAALPEWFESVVSVAVGIRATYVPVHPAVTGIYALITVSFKFYDVFIFAIIIVAAWERFNPSSESGSGGNNKSHPKKTDELSAPHTAASASSYHQQHHVPFTDAAQLGVYWNASAPDDLALFLNQQHQQAYAARSVPMSMNV
jgi:hypothetical protein